MIKEHCGIPYQCGCAMICKMTQKELEALMHFVQDAVDVILLSTIELSKKDPTFLESLVNSYEEESGKPQAAKEEETEEQLKELDALLQKKAFKA